MPTTRAAFGLARSSSASRGRAWTATTSPPRPSRAGRSRSSSSGRSSSACRASSSRRPRCHGPRRRPLLRPAPRELEVAGVTGTNGKTTTAFLLHSVLDAAGRRPGLLGTVESRVGGERRPASLGRRRGDRPPAHVSRDARPGRPQLRDGGLVARLGAAPAGRRALRRARLHEPDAGSPRLPRDDGALLRGQAAPLRRPERPPAAVNVGDPYGRRLADELRRGRAPVVTFGLEPDAEVRPSASRSPRRAPPHGRRHRAADAAPRPLQRRERARDGRRPGGCSTWRTTRSPRRGVARGRAGALRGGRRGPAVRRPRRLRAHARLAPRTCSSPRASSPTGG